MSPWIPGWAPESLTTSISLLVNVRVEVGHESMDRRLGPGINDDVKLLAFQSSASES